MSGGWEDADDSFIDVPTAPTTNLVPQKKTLKPWHAPRKQWVRLHQWNAQIDQLIAQLGKGDERPLSYLSLPGTDLLDVRSLWELCNRREMTLKYLGFNDPDMEATADSTALNIAEAELLKRPHVHPRSRVVKDRLERLAVPNSVAHDALREFGSLDVINLDLTNCVAQHIPNERQADYYRAMHQLFDHQRRTRVTPFLFFLTTRVNEEQLDPTAFKTLLGVLLENMRSHVGFSEKVRSTFGIEEAHLATASASPNFDGVRRCLDTVFGLSFAKWMLKLLLAGQPAWTIEMQESCAYTVRNLGAPDMFSYAFLCKPVEKPAYDHYQLSKLVAEPVSNAGLEATLAERLVDGVNDIFDLDAHLHDDPRLTREVVASSAELMRQAHYDPVEYRAFAAERLEKVSGWLRARYGA